MSKEAIERLEAIEWAENGACYICKAVEPTHESYCALKQVITLLKQQPIEGELTKLLRRYSRTCASGPIVQNALNEAADRLDSAEARLKKALEPIVEWYGGGTEGNRSDIEILTDVVSDLQKDRAEVLKQAKRIKELEARVKKLLEALEEAADDFYYIHKHPENAHTDSYNFMEKVKQAKKEG